MPWMKRPWNAHGRNAVFKDQKREKPMKDLDLFDHADRDQTLKVIASPPVGLFQKIEVDPDRPLPAVFDMYTITRQTKHQTGRIHSKRKTPANAFCCW